MVKFQTDINIALITEIAMQAGKAVLEIYNANLDNVEFKSDNSPITNADKISHEIIKTELQEYYPDIPVLSEEGKDIPYKERKHWRRFWLVDPLDGTKEFLKRNGEFTINIALIQKHSPIIGVIYSPVLDVLYFAQKGLGAFKKEGEKYKRISVNKNHGEIIAVKSRSHSSHEEDEILSTLDIKESISIGSSLKFCFIAEGRASIYYRQGNTYEWDTAAGHAIVQAANGFVQYINGNFEYNKKELLNNSFIASSFNPENLIRKINETKETAKAI